MCPRKKLYETLRKRIKKTKQLFFFKYYTLDFLPQIEKNKNTIFWTPSTKFFTFWCACCVFVLAGLNIMENLTRFLPGFWVYGSRVWGVTVKAYAWRCGGDGFNSKVVPTAAMSDARH